jgi:hypothetical protein
MTRAQEIVEELLTTIASLKEELAKSKPRPSVTRPAARLIQTRLRELKPLVEPPPIVVEPPPIVVEPPPPPPPPPPIGIPVRPGDNLASLAEQAAANTTFDVDPEYKAEHNIAIDKPLTFRSFALPAGVRVSASLVGPTIYGEQVLGTDARWMGFRFIGKVHSSAVITMRDRSVVDRCVVLGSLNGQRRGIAVNCVGARVYHSHIDDLWYDREPQAICGWTRTKDFECVDSYLGASGEVVMFGGDDAASEANIPNGIRIINCDQIKKLAWRTMPYVSCKNICELKNAKNVLISGGSMQNNWGPTQSGYAIVLTVRNQNGRDPYSTIQDVVIEDVLIKGVGAGISILGRDNILDPATGIVRTSVRMERVTLRRLKFQDLSRDAWGPAAHGRCVQISGGPKDLTLEGLDFSGANIHSALFFDEPQFTLDGLAVRDTRFEEGEYGICGSGVGIGTKVMAAYNPRGYAWERITVIRRRANNYDYPAGTNLVTTA